MPNFCIVVLGTDEQESRLMKWKRSSLTRDTKLAIVEFGAGVSVATVRSGIAFIMLVN